MRKSKDLSGQKIHAWTVIDRFNTINGNLFWRCRCACGTVRPVMAANLLKGKSRSCGCLLQKDMNERLWSRVLKMPGGCWEWQGSRTQFGYGKLTVNQKCVDAHRLAYSVAVGEIPEGLFVLHRCDNPPCCNPDHLFLGTPKDNMVDRQVKGRAARKLDEQTVVAIILQRNNTSDSFAKIASSFGISKRMAMLICKGKAWSHIAQTMIRGVQP